MRFHAARWAQAFLAAAGGDWQSGFDALRAFSAARSRAHGWISGTTAARQAAALLDRAITKAGGTASDGVKAAEATLGLLIARGFLNEFAAFVEAVQRAADERAGVLHVRLEAAGEPDAGFLAGLKPVIAARYDARDVCFEVADAPELIAGCRLTMGSERQDFSLQGRITQMQERLQR